MGSEEEPSWLLLRHFPSWLTPGDKESLLTHFGAVQVVTMPTWGKMRNCVFAEFSCHADASQALGKLHQLKVFGKRLVVEYARSDHEKLMLQAEKDKWACNKSKKKDGGARGETREEKPSPARSPPKSSSPVSPVSQVRYLYPPATPTILANITSTLMCVPEFYQQVLHLMNRMNLPPPFGALTPAPPLLVSPEAMLVSTLGAAPPLLVSPEAMLPLGEEGEERQEGEEEDEEEGSEIESDPEEREKRKKRERAPAQQPTAKRRKVSYQQVKNLQSSLKKTTTAPASSEESLPQASQRLKIELKVPRELGAQSEESSGHTVTYIQPISAPTSTTDVNPVPATKSLPTLRTTPGASRSPPPPPPLPTHTPVSTVPSETPAMVPQASTFIPVATSAMDSVSADTEPKEEFISLSELQSNRLSQAEMKDSHVYKNYSPGESSTRLYVKNLAKQVEEKDLRYIFGRYINWDAEIQKNMFDIRLMQSGRMKGQAFVGMPDREVAAEALRHANGYLLHGKPMVVHFARSSKPKDKEQ